MKLVRKKSWMGTVNRLHGNIKCIDSFTNKLDI